MGKNLLQNYFGKISRTKTPSMLLFLALQKGKRKYLLLLVCEQTPFQDLLRAIHHFLTH